jgi:hypothetical protein
MFPMQLLAHGFPVGLLLVAIDIADIATAAAMGHAAAVGAASSAQCHVARLRG